MMDFGFYNMDCMEGMKEFPDNYFDLAIVDPPYGIGEDGRRSKSRAINTSKWKNAKPVNYKPKKWDDKKPDKRYFEELKRVSKHQIIWGGNYFVKHIDVKMGWIVWYKAGQNPNTDFSDCELAYTSFQRALKFIDIAWLAFGAVNLGEQRIHPTQKPVKLYRWTLLNYAKAGWKILDTHFGSASSLIACEWEGFDYVAFERDADYYTDATKRIEMWRKGRTIDMFESKNH